LPTFEGAGFGGGCCGLLQIVNVDTSGNAITIKSQTFKFDRVFDQEAQQEDVFAYIRCVGAGWCAVDGGGGGKGLQG
jgi:hypothetical protein